MRYPFIICLILSITACKKEETQSIKTTSNLPLFTQLEPSKTNVLFSNDLTENETLNPFKYEYFYNGAGVSVGDINNDGLVDIYFTGNMVDDKLFLNQGNFEFKDITTKALGQQKQGWHTGATMADVNGDGLLDIYVCRGGYKDIYEDQRNLLYINNGDLTFTEQAQSYGLDDDLNSTQAAFFDYDLDGDLDVYVMNIPDLLIEFTRETYQELFKSKNNKSDHFYENQNGKFIDKSKDLGINNHAFGLGLCISDIDNNGYPDIYIANDYEDRDYLFMNRNGKFNEEIRQRTRHTSVFGMGLDIADFNNDGHNDIIELDMAFPTHKRSKMNMSAMSTEKFWAMVNSGNHYQYMVNTLQLNNGNGTFSEIGQLAHISKTDWSWGALLADFDNDGYKDLVVTNGREKDLKDRDFQNKLSQQISEKGSLSLDDVYAFAPSSVQSNYVFKNNTDLTFSDSTEDWGLDEKINSNGIAYADLDNDGDLDLILNNVNNYASIYKNTTDKNNNYIAFQLKGYKKNTFALGTKIKIYTENEMQIQEVSPTRGYLSCVDTRLNFGLAENSKLKKVEIIWPDQKTTTLTSLKINQIHSIDYKSSSIRDFEKKKRAPFIFSDITQTKLLEYHKENKFNDWDREVLLPYALSTQGPCIVVGDVNNDQLDDIFIGGSSGNLSRIHIQREDGRFETSTNNPFQDDVLSEDIGALFFDADSDGDMDLYVCSGGNEFNKNSKVLQDRLYINDGKGNFIKNTKALPKMISSTKVVESGDIDNDGDLDLFVGGRLTPGEYPKASRSYILRNDNGVFKDVTYDIAKDLAFTGMVTGAKLEDINNDNLKDLTIVGEWMGFTQFLNNGDTFERRDLDITTQGLWFSLYSGDVDGDGDTDFIAGNLGANSKFKASIEKPFNIYGHDFDDNGSYDMVLSAYEGNINYPVRGKECSSQQVPSLREKFPTFKSFAESDIYQLYGDKLDEALHLEARHLKSSIFINDGNGNFEMQSLPIEAQFSPIMGITLEDINNDSHLDIIAAGNLYEAEVETIRFDAGRGVCLLGDGKGNFKPISPEVSGFFAWNNAKSLTACTIRGRKAFIVGINNSYPQIFIVN